MLTRFDEYPVHQSPHPFSVVPITDYAFDDGYFFSVFNPDENLFCMTGLRVNPNSDMVGGYAAVMLDGLQYTVRFSRVWRPHCDTVIGPLSYEFVEPYRDIHLVLDDNDSELRFDLHWLGVSQAYLEPHHQAWNRQRITTDQSRYSQSGTARGWIEFKGHRWAVEPGSWFGSRDHSWGIYASRRPLAPERRWLPPPEVPAVRRALRFWTNFGTDAYSGFYHLHESTAGEQLEMNDVFGTPFQGGIDHGWDGPHVELVAGEHQIEFQPGTRIMRAATITLTDAASGRWVQRFEVTGPGWNPHTIGYGPGSWKDGGSMYSYHGSDGPVMEWDEFDWSVQPYDLETYEGRRLTGVYGPEYLSRVTSTAPDGTVSTGAAHTELFIDGDYRPYGFTAQRPPTRPHSTG